MAAGTADAVSEVNSGAAGATGSADKEGTVTLLTEDGKLVEVSRSVYKKINSGKKASKDDIRQFIHPDRSKKS